MICLLALAANAGKPKARQVPREVFRRWDRVRVAAPSGAKFVASCTGAMLTAIDNYRAMRQGESSAVWRSFAAKPEIRHALSLVSGASDNRRRR